MAKKKKTIVIKSSDKTAIEVIRGNLKSEKNMITRSIDENGYEQGKKKTDYTLSRWGQEVVKILEDNGEMKNVDIMDELRKRGCNTSANHINKFFKSEDGKRFYKEQLVGNQSYWSLRNK